MLIFCCVDNIYIYAAHERPVTLKKRLSAPLFCSGPHFHGGVKFNGARVNPYSLIELPFKNGGTTPPTATVPIPETPPTPQAVPVRE